MQNGNRVIKTEGRIFRERKEWEKKKEESKAGVYEELKLRKKNKRLEADTGRKKK